MHTRWRGAFRLGHGRHGGRVVSVSAGLRRARAAHRGGALLGTCVGGCFVGGSFNILYFAQSDMANGIAVTQTQLARNDFLFWSKSPPLKPPPTQVPSSGPTGARGAETAEDTLRGLAPHYTI